MSGDDYIDEIRRKRICSSCVDESFLSAEIGSYMSFTAWTQAPRHSVILKGIWA